MALSFERQNNLLRGFSIHPKKPDFSMLPALRGQANANQLSPVRDKTWSANYV